MKEKILKWFKLGLWTEEMIRNAVEKKVLTKEEMNEILNGGNE